MFCWWTRLKWTCYCHSSIYLRLGFTFRIWCMPFFILRFTIFKFSSTFVWFVLTWKTCQRYLSLTQWTLIKFVWKHLWRTNGLIICKVNLLLLHELSIICSHDLLKRSIIWLFTRAKILCFAQNTLIDIKSSCSLV